MKNISSILLFVSLCIVSFGFAKKQYIFSLLSATVYSDTEYVCMPCGSSCDKAIYNKAGTCSHCNMQLVDKSTVKFKSIEPDAICSFIADMGKANVVLLDVRTPDEFKGTAPEKFGRLSGAVNIPIQELTKRIKELKKYKDKEIIVYCSHSHRSPRACYILMQNGFTNVINMEFGMSEWQQKVKPGKCNSLLYIKQ